MKRKRIISQEQENKLSKILNSIEKRLLICFGFLLIVLIITQALLYFNIGNGFLNPVYKMEGNLFSKQDKSIYSLFCIYGEIPEYEDVWVMKNGIKIDRIIRERPIYIYLFPGDVIEIDATRSSGIPHEIFIENITSSNKSLEAFREKLVLTNKFYQMPAFYSN